MALSGKARRDAAIGLGDPDAGDEFCDVIDANTGTCTNHLVRYLNQSFGPDDAALYITALNSGTGGTMGGSAQRKSEKLFGLDSAREINAAILANA